VNLLFVFEKLKLIELNHIIILKNKGLYKGFSIAAVGIVPAQAIYVSSYEVLFFILVYFIHFFLVMNSNSSSTKKVISLSS